MMTKAAVCTEAVFERDIRGGLPIRVDSLGLLSPRTFAVGFVLRFQTPHLVHVSIALSPRQLRRSGHGQHL